MRVFKFLSAKWAKEAVLQQRLKISLLTALNDPWDGHGLRFSSELHKGAWGRTLSQLAQSKGILCFSREWDDPVQWSHYGDQHRGIVLGFDASPEYCMEMIYRKDLADFDRLTGTAENDRVKHILTIFSIKYTNWQYEKEVRMFVGIDDPDDESGHFFKKFDQDLSLKEIIFGARFQNPEDMAVILARARKDTAVSCRMAKMGNQTFRMEDDPFWSAQ